MSHSKNKVEWCIKKAEKELAVGDKHRGLVKINPDTGKAREHIKKAEHYLMASDYLKKGNFSDISTSTFFYSVYHCLLAIALKFGHESRNQECTFALMHNLIEDRKIEFDKDLLDKIAKIDTEKTEEKTTVELREQYQYGVGLSIKDDLYNELLGLAKEVLSKAKLIIEG